MNNKGMIGSFLYSIAQITQGLFFHPYQTVQSLVREKVFFWLIFLPTMVWLIAHSLWLLVIVPLVSLMFSCTSLALPVCSLIPFLANWLFSFCLLWQLVLLYLFLRFGYALQAKN